MFVCDHEIFPYFVTNLDPYWIPFKIYHKHLLFYSRKKERKNPETRGYHQTEVKLYYFFHII